MTCVVEQTTRFLQCSSTGILSEVKPTANNGVVNAVQRLLVIVDGLHGRPCFTAVAVLCLYVARSRALVAALAMKGLVTNRKRSRNG